MGDTFVEDSWKKSTTFNDMVKANLEQTTLNHLKYYCERTERYSAHMLQ